MRVGGSAQCRCYEDSAHSIKRLESYQRATMPTRVKSTLNRVLISKSVFLIFSVIRHRFLKFPTACLSGSIVQLTEIRIESTSLDTIAYPRVVETGDCHLDCCQFGRSCFHPRCHSKLSLVGPPRTRSSLGRNSRFTHHCRYSRPPSRHVHSLDCFTRGKRTIAPTDQRE